MRYDVPHDRATLEYNTLVIVSRDADLTENYVYILMKFRTGVHVFCSEVGVFNRSCFQSVSCNQSFRVLFSHFGIVTWIG